MYNMSQFINKQKLLKVILFVQHRGKKALLNIESFKRKDEHILNYRQDVLFREWQSRKLLCTIRKKHKIKTLQIH